MKTDNEIIAEFMGYDVHDYELFKKTVRCYSIKSSDSVEVARNRRHVNTLKYDTAWDWLMPVVERIERIRGVHFVISELRSDIYSFGKQISNCREETKILTVYRAVVEFIKWYNQQNQ